MTHEQGAEKFPFLGSLLKKGQMQGAHAHDRGGVCCVYAAQGSTARNIARAVVQPPFAAATGQGAVVQLPFAAATGQGAVVQLPLMQTQEILLRASCRSRGACRVRPRRRHRAHRGFVRGCVPWEWE